MTTSSSSAPAVVGVLALQGAFSEHLQLLRLAADTLTPPYPFAFIPVKTPQDLARCVALIIPGGESTTMALIAARSGLLEPLRAFVNVSRRPTWGTCAGMILLSAAANRTKAGGQDLIGGLDVRVNRNHFGRQVESFTTDLELECLGDGEAAFRGVFIRAPIVESVLGEGEVGGSDSGDAGGATVRGDKGRGEVQVLARLERALLPVEGMSRSDRRLSETNSHGQIASEAGETDVLRERERVSKASSIVAVRQGNVVGTSFHPELTADTRMHRWWLQLVVADLESRERTGERAGGIE